MTEGALVGQGEATLLTTVEQIGSDLRELRSAGVRGPGAASRAQTAGAVTLVDPNKAQVQLIFTDGTPPRTSRFARFFRRECGSDHGRRRVSRPHSERGPAPVAGSVRQPASHHR